MNFQEQLINWYDNNKRDLPFRDQSDPYKIWVSEIMLQQTTVAAVIPYYKRFMERFPDVKTLALSSLDEVYKYWEGLGYYRRAKHLYESSIQIMEDFAGVFPKDYEDVLSLKGVGPYTASAICSFAYKQSYSAIDGNALRVLARLDRIHDNIAEAKTIREITKKSNEWIIGYDSSKYNQGLMDLANAICKVKNPQCEICPLNTNCQAYRHHEEKVLPIHIKKIKKQELCFITGVITYDDKMMLIKNKEGLLENMYGLLQYEVESPYSFVEAFEKEYGISLTIASDIKEFKHVFTHRTWHMHVYHMIASQETDDFYDQKTIETLAIPTAHKKILTYLKQEANER